MHHHLIIRSSTLRKPLSELECSARRTVDPAWTASRTSWCDISPVSHTSERVPLSTELPDPAHDAIVDTGDSVRDSYEL